MNLSESCEGLFSLTILSVRKLRGTFHTDNIASMKQRTFVHHKTGKPATMNTANIGKPKAEVELVLDVDDAKGLEKAVWDYTQKNSMALRWRAFVDSLLKMLKIEDSIIRDFSHDEFVTRLGSMKESQLSESHERLIQTADWLANIIRALEDTNDARSSTNQDTATDVRH